MNTGLSIDYQVLVSVCLTDYVVGVMILTIINDHTHLFSVTTHINHSPDDNSW